MRVGVVQLLKTHSKQENKVMKTIFLEIDMPHRVYQINKCMFIEKVV